MKRQKQPVFLLVSILTVIILFLSSCVHDRIVINGEMAQYLAEVTNDQLFDPAGDLRGNTTSNMLNGGYLLSDNEDIWFIHPMSFDDGSEIHYLQHLLKSQTGNATNRNNFIVELEGVLIGTQQGRLFAIDQANNDRLIAIDLNSYSTEIISESPVSAAHLLDDTLYWSTAEGGDLWLLHLYGIGTKAKLVMAGAGKLIGIQSGFAYTEKDKMVLATIDITQEREIGTITGGNYTQASIAGSWIYFKDEGCLKRQHLGSGHPIITVMCDVAEYSVEDYWLAVIRASGGIVVSNLDGTGVMPISNDLAEGLQLVNNYLYYYNGYDDGAIYTIDLAEGWRSSLLGVSVTDGGIQFVSLPEENEALWLEQFGDFARQVHETQAFTERTQERLQGNVLFVEFSLDSNDLIFHRLKDSDFSPDEVGVLAIITHHPTLLGQYTDGDLAYRLDSKITVFTPDNPKPLLTWSVLGLPPSEIKIGSGNRYGMLSSWHQRGLDLIELINALQ